jgi:DNA-binding SARP family transcriptional activator
VKGDAREAERALERARSTFEAAGYQEATKLPLESQLWLAVQKKQLSRIETLTTGIDATEVTSVYDLALLLPWARGLADAGEKPRARALLEVAIPAATALEAWPLHARFQALQAELEHGPEPVAAKASGLKVHLFGDMEVEKDGARLDSWPRRKAKLLLAILTLYPRGLSVTDLAELLAEGEVGGNAVMIVQQNVSALRKALGQPVAFANERYTLTEEPWSDVREFERHVADGRLDQAVAVYRGNLLEEPFFERYLGAERERLRRQALDCLFKLAEHCTAIGDFTNARARLERAVQLAPIEWEATERLMAHHADRKQPERLQHAYWDYRKALKARLGLTPDDENERAFKQQLERAR